MKKYSFLLICLALSFSAMAQKAVISFAEKSFDFGKIYEKDGNVTHVFEFVNKGDGPLVINRVHYRYLYNCWSSQSLHQTNNSLLKRSE